MDPLSQLIANEVARRMELTQPRIPYGVWIDGAGWLKNDGGRVFADLHIEVAQGAARLWGEGATVMPIDLPDADGKSALQTLEAQFLARQQLARAQTWKFRLRQWVRRWYGNSFPIRN